MKKKQNETVREEILAAVEQAKKLNTDIFEFGEEFHRRYPDLWPHLESQWASLFPQLRVNITVKSKIDDTGLIIGPLFNRR